MITAVNELRHRAAFALWTAWLRFQLGRRGGRLELDAPHGARMDGWPRVAVAGRAGTVRLRVGRGVKLGGALHLDAEHGSLTLGDGVTFGHGVRLQLRGGSIALGSGTTVRDGCVLKADGDLRVGEGVLLSFGVVLACTERIELGDLCGLGERVSVIDSDHVVDGTGEHWARQPLRTAPVRLGRNVLVSAGVTILRGADIGDNAQVGAGAVVGRGEHPGGWLLTGAPAKPLKRLAERGDQA